MIWRDRDHQVQPVRARVPSDVITRAPIHVPSHYQRRSSVHVVRRAEELHDIGVVQTTQHAYLAVYSLIDHPSAPSYRNRTFTKAPAPSWRELDRMCALSKRVAILLRPAGGFYFYF